MRCPGAKKTLRVGDSKTGEVSTLTTGVIVNAAGLQAQEVAASLADFPQEHVPKRYLARGCYFTLSGAHCDPAQMSPSQRPGCLLRKGTCCRSGYWSVFIRCARHLQVRNLCVFYFPVMVSSGWASACGGCQLMCLLSERHVLYSQDWCLLQASRPSGISSTQCRRMAAWAPI